MESLALARSSGLVALPQRNSRALWMSAWSGVRSLARCGSSGLAQPSRMLAMSRNGSKALCQPGGVGLKDLPVVSSTLGMTKCNSWCPAWAWRTHKILYWSGSSPAKATFSKSSMTRRSCSGVTLSSGCHDSTPATNLCLKSTLSIRSAVVWTLPRNTSGGCLSLPG